MLPLPLSRLLRSSSRRILTGSLLLLGATPSITLAITWNGGAGDDLFGSGANWIGGSAPSPGVTTDLVFDGSARLTPNNNYTAFDDFHSITFSATAGAFNVGGNAIDLFGKIENYSTLTQTISLAALAINGGQVGTGEFNPVNGDLAINSADVFTNGNNIRIFGVNNKTVTFGAGTVISQGGGVVVEQASNVVLLGTNTYTGGTTLNAGTLTVGNGGTNGSISAASAVSIAGGAAMTWNNNNNSTSNLTLANSISGAGTLTLQGQNAVSALQTSVYVLSGNNSGFTGTLNINRAMVFNTTAQSQIGGAAIVVQDRGTMAFNGGAYNNSITVQNGAGWHNNVGGDVVIGAIRLEGTNTLTGNITLNNTTGIVLGDNTGANSTIAGWSAGTHALNGVISGAGDLAMSRYTSWNSGAPQAVNITLGGTASNTFTGKTVVDGQSGAASLILAKTGGAVAIAPNTVVQFGSATAGQSNLRMGGSNQFGSGVVMNFVNTAGNWGRFDLLDTNQTLAGLNAGNATTLGGAVIQNGGININTTSGTSTLSLDGTGSYLYNGYIRNVDTGGTGKLALLKTGSGSQTLVGPQITYTGATTINGGSLVFQDTTAIGSAMTVNAGGTLGAVRTALGGAGRSQIMANAVTLAGGILSIDNAGSGLAGGWTTFGVANGLTGSGTINVNSGVFSRDNTVANAINTSATVNVAAGAFFGAGRGGNSTIGALNGAGVVSTLWAGGNAGSITIGNGDGSGSFSGTLDGNGTNASDLTQQGGVLSVIKTGGGMQTLTGANTYSGTTTVNGGSLVIQNLPTGSNNGNVVGGRVFTTSSLNVATGATVVVDLGANSLASTNSGLTLSGAGTIRKNGAGIWWLGNAAGGTAISMASGGLIDVQGGVLKNDYANANWSGNSGDLNIATGASVDMRNNAVRVGALTGSGLLDNAFSSPQTLTVGAGGAGGTFTGNVKQTGGGALSVTKIGAGTQTLGGSATSYSGTTTVSQGSLVLDGTNLVTASPWSIAAGANLTINYANTAVDTWVSGGAITGTGTLTKTGPGWFLFKDSAPANFQGSIVINGGRLGNGFNTTVWTNSKADVFVGAGAELDLRVDDMIVDELTGSGTIVNTYALGGSDTLTVGSNNGSSQFDGVIRGIGGVGAINTSIDVGRNNLAKIGTGTFTVTGASVYGGTTTVSNGILRIGGGSDRLPAGTTLAVNGGATVGGTFDLNALNQTVSALTAGSGAVPGIVTNLAAGTGTLSVSGTSTFAGMLQDGGAGKILGLTKSGNGTLILTGANTHSGTTLITGGALRQATATALSPNSNITMNGGIVELGVTDFTAALGTGNGQVQFTGSGGFGALGGTRIVNIGGAGGTMTWNAGNFVPTGSSLILSGPNSDSTTRFLNPVDLNSGAGRITSLGGTAAIDAELAGNISNGTLTLAPGNSTFAVTGQISGSVIVENGNTSGTNFQQLLLNRTGGNAVTGSLQIGTAAITDPGAFTTVRLEAAGQIADTSVVTFGAAQGRWAYFNLNGFDETIGGLNSLSGRDGGVVQLVEGDASPATNSTLTLNVTSGTQSYFGHIRDRQNGFSNHATAGKLNFVKTGAGTQELATWNNQTWSGTTSVQQGTLRLILNNAAALPGAVTVDTGATLDLAPAGTNNYNLSGGLSGNGTIVKTGTGTANLYNSTVDLTGSILIQAGRLRNDGNATNWSDASASVDISAAGTLDLRADSVQVDALTGTGSITNTFGNGAGLYDTLTVGVADGGGTFSGTITDFGAAGSGENMGGIAVTKTGTGTQTLAGVNSYTGTTAVNGGTLQLSGTGQLSSTSTVAVRGGTLLLDGTAANRVNDLASVSIGGSTAGSHLVMAGPVTESMGALTLTSGSGVRVIDFGSGSSLLTFASIASDATTVAVQIWNWSGTTVSGSGPDQLRITSGLLGANIDLTDISFFSGSGTGLYTQPTGFTGIDGKELAPVPEAGGVLTALLLLGSAGWRERRKLLRVRPRLL